MAKTTENPVNQETGEIKGAYSFDPAAVKTKKIVNLPTLSQKNVGSIYVAFLGAMFVGLPMKAVDKKDEKEEPATLANVVDLMTGKPAQIVVPTVQQSVLEENYPGNTYVGKAFKLENHGKLNGKRYNSISIVEIDLPEGIDIKELQALTVTK